jgi:hypothetical protein
MSIILVDTTIRKTILSRFFITSNFGQLEKALKGRENRMIL